MNALVALVLIAPAQDPKPKDPPAKEVKPEVGFGLSPQSEYHWPLYVLTSPDVQKELKLTKEQIAKIDGLQKELGKKVMDGAATLPVAKLKAHFLACGQWADKAVADLLTTEQRPRHRQIVWQVQECSSGGVRGMAANPVFAREVGLTADQQKQAAKIEADFRAAWLKLVQAGPGRNAPLPGEDALVKKSEEAALKLLTAEQKKKWNEVLGEPFQGDVVPFPVPGQRPNPFKIPAEKK